MDEVQCNLSESDVSLIFLNLRPSRTALFNHVNNKYYEKGQAVGKQVMRYNMVIKINGKTLYYPECHNKGIPYMYLEYVFDCRAKLLYTLDSITFSCNISNNDFLKYYSLVKCISRQMFEILNFHVFSKVLPTKALCFQVIQ